MVTKAATFLRERVIVWVITAIVGGLAVNILWLNVTALGVRDTRNTKVEGTVRDGRLEKLEGKHENGIEKDIKEMRGELQVIRIQLTRIITQLELQEER